MSLQTIRKLMAKAGADSCMDALPSADSLTWIENALDEAESPSLLIGNVGNRNVLTYLLPSGGGWEVRYCLRSIGDDRATSTLPSITGDEAMTKPLIVPFKYFTDGTKTKKRMLSMIIRYYFLLQGHISKIDAWNDDFSRRLSSVLRKVYGNTDGSHGTYKHPQETGETVEESSEPEDMESPNGLLPANRNGLVNAPESNVTYDTPHGMSWDGNPDLQLLWSYLAERGALRLLENIPDAHDMEFLDQTYILEAQPKKLFVGTHAKTEHRIYAYMVRIAQRGFHEIRFYLESARGTYASMSAEATGKQRILHPFSKTYPRSTGPSDPPDKARLTLMVKWYFIAAGIATDCVLHETKAYPERLRCALEYISDQMGPSAFKSSGTVPVDDSIADESSESSYTPEKANTQSTLANEPTPKAPRFPQSVARKSAPSIARRTIPHATTTQKPLPKTSFSKSASPEADATPTAPPRNSKRSAEDEEFDALTRLVMQQNALTKDLNNVDHELEVMDARFEAFQEKWKRERAELEKKRDEIEERRAEVRNMFKRRRTLDVESD
ncbi:uncharacterized protein J4E84_009353 [Alternaria hordeiaustralica]|uniref:uncharacterized protein n=1 Tax=Alternaria hordeiaustralica TaxID=1187925 RepID=UPI0020C411A1|nr:uncharacterized protein J4E84_009353 [Alternaria hordeiaustralica]KAI4676759.1 hypothetical protein J4E84_009353 [Alternaria hordeiaustralica]